MMKTNSQHDNYGKQINLVLSTLEWIHKKMALVIYDLEDSWFVPTDDNATNTSSQTTEGRMFWYLVTASTKSSS